MGLDFWKLQRFRKFSKISLSHCCFLFLVLSSILFVCSISNMEITRTLRLPRYNPNWRLEFVRLLQSLDTTGSSLSPDTLEAFEYDSDHRAVTEPAHATQTTTSQKPTTPTTTGDGLDDEEVPEENNNGDGSTPVPYVPLGPYLVEYPYDYKYIINEPDKCQRQKPFVVLIVPLAPYNRHHRDIIRSTWGSEPVVQGKAVSLFFILGRQSGDRAKKVQRGLRQESKEHHDIIQSNFVDCYKNLTIKTMVMMEWLAAYCPNASYAMKIDSDMFLNVKNLIILLLMAPKSDYMTGLVAKGYSVFRDPASKWYLPEDLYPEPIYPTYALGLGYVVSLDLPKRIVEAAKHIRALYVEDVYVGLCVRHLGVTPVDYSNWYNFHVIPYPYDRCEYSKIIASMTDDSMDLVWMWHDFKRIGPYC